MKTSFKGGMSFTANKYLDAVLVLSDGDFWMGKGVGIRGETKGEICFNVSMTGHQEIMTDPSYAGQIINFTFPHIGNVGANREDLESQQIYCKGLVLREPVTRPSNCRSSGHFEDWLVENQVVGLSGVDTRALTRNVRETGPREALIYFGEQGEVIVIDELVEKAKGESSLLGADLAAQVSVGEPYHWDEGAYTMGQKAYPVRPHGVYHVVVIDYGVKRNILRRLVDSGFKVTVVPALAHIEEILQYEPDGVFLSNGPGNPFATSKYVRQVIDGILDRDIPLFGICLGNQLLALASELNTIKLPCGHRGANHPVKNLRTHRVEITSQNHGFCVSRENIPDYVEVTHESLFDGTVEGIRRKDKYAFAVQYHPESSPGPHDSHYLFREFYKMIEASKKNRTFVPFQSDDRDMGRLSGMDNLGSADGVDGRL